MALHHKLCHTLGGALNLPHAETHAAILQHAVVYNASTDPHAMSRIARALGANDAAGRLFELAGEIGVCRSLKDIGMRGEDIDHAADLAVKNPYWNPRQIERYRGINTYRVFGTHRTMPRLLQRDARRRKPVAASRPAIEAS